MMARMALALCIVAMSAANGAAASDAVVAGDRVMRYGFSIVNPDAEVKRDVVLRVFAPVARTSYQVLDHVEASHPYRLTTDTSGNQTLRFEFARIAPYGRHHISITAHLKSYEQPKPQALLDASRYLQAEPYVETDHPELIQAARHLETASDVPFAGYHWVIDNLRYAGYIAQNRGALYALRNRLGDCTEYMYLFMALMRINGIPARAVAGFVLPFGDARVGAADYHNWAEIYLNGAWRLVDAQKQRYFEGNATYVATRFLNTGGRDGPQEVQRFSVNDSSLLVTME